MTREQAKSATDLHWNARAATEPSDAQVNIADVVQRELENQFILPLLPRDGRVLEAGCGNGYLTRELRGRVKHVDAFDYAENMVERAKKAVGETNNRFFHDNILDLRHVQPPYDAAVCVRVLINLRDRAEQETAVKSLAGVLQKGASLLLVEGYLDGFEALNELRRKVGVDSMAPASINFYSRLEELMPLISHYFTIAERFHTGFFDVMTRVAYPLLVGAQKASGPSEFHQKLLPLMKCLNCDEFAEYARLRGFQLIRR